MTGYSFCSDDDAELDGAAVESDEDEDADAEPRREPSKCLPVDESHFVFRGDHLAVWNAPVSDDLIDLLNERIVLKMAAVKDKDKPNNAKPADPPLLKLLHRVESKIDKQSCFPRLQSEEGKIAFANALGITLHHGLLDGCLFVECALAQICLLRSP